MKTLSRLFASIALLTGLAVGSVGWAVDYDFKDSEHEGIYERSFGEDGSITNQW